MPGVSVAPGVVAASFATGLLLGIAGFEAPATADEPTVIEQLIATRNPCKDFKTEQFGVTIGIDKLKEVKLLSASAKLDGNDVSLSFDGRLACETSNAAVLTGDAAASVSATATMSLTDCDVAAFDVSLSQFAGTFGGLLQALAPGVEAEIVAAARPKLVDACQQFGGSGG